MNHTDAVTTVVHHLPKIMVDFELLWWCISKIWNQPEGDADRLNTKIGIIKYSI